MTASHSLIGAWSLVFAHHINDETGDKTNYLGDEPQGYLIFQAGRSFAFLRLPPNQGAPAGFLAYSGPCKVTPETFITSIDMASRNDWVGTQQTRLYKLAGDELDVTTAPMRGPSGALMHYRLMWKRKD